MEDWGDDDEDLDPAAVAALEQKALSERRTVMTAAQAAQQEPQRPQQEPQRPLGPPRTAAELRHRCKLFQQAPPPTRRPTHDRCPGVYGRGCGGEPKLVQFSGDSCFFWACSAWPECAYREFPPPTKCAPELCITLDRKCGTVEVSAALGAEEAAQFCGGLPAVLQVAGIDLRRALHVQPQPAPGATPAAAPCIGQAAAAAEAAEAETALLLAARAGGRAADTKAPADNKGAVNVAFARPEGRPAAPTPAAPSLQPMAFPISDYERLSSQLLQFSRQHGTCLLSSASMIPAPTLRAARGTLRTLPPCDQVQQLYGRMPPFLERALLPFQREGVLFALARGGRCLIADEMGVGKTLQAIALASIFQDEWPLLIIVPASLRLVWAEELEKWLPHLRPSSIHVIEGKEDRVAQGSLPLVTITSYEMMQRLTCDACKGRAAQHSSMCAGQRPPCKDAQNCMASQRWKVVIVDESHTLRTSSKPPDALHTEAAVSAVKLARRAILLTGTPSLSRPFDLFRQVDAVMPGLLGHNRTCFASAYCNRREVPLPAGQGGGERCMRWDVSGLSRGAELHDMLKAEVMLRRLKSEVLSQLPPKRRQVIRLPKPPASEWPQLLLGARKHADDSEGSDSTGEEDEHEEEAGDGGEGACGCSSKAHAKPMSAAHRTGLAKASSVIDWLMTALGVRSGGARGARKVPEDDDAIDIGGGGNCVHGAITDDVLPKFLVFGHHKTVMTRIAAALEGATGYAPVSYVRIDGGTDSEDRRVAVRRFHSDASLRVALLSITAAGVGLDFSAASVVVFAELPDEVAHVRQAEDRAHRQGQRQPVNIYFLCAKGTTDDRRWQHLNRSLAKVSAVHDGAAVASGTGAADAHAPAGNGAAGGEACSRPQAGREGGLAAAAAQAGLLVECVVDAEEAGLTPAAAKAGWAAVTNPVSGGQPGTQTGESPLAAAPAAGAATGRPAGDDATAGQGMAAAESAGPCDQQDLTTNISAASCSEQLGDEQAPQPAAQPAPASPAIAGRRQPSRGRREPSIAARPPMSACNLAASSLSAELPPAGAGSFPLGSLPQAAQAQPVEVWFEVSSNTSRVHLHCAADGTAPLRLSLPMEVLLVGESPPLEELLQAVSLGSRQLEQQESALLPVEGTQSAQGGAGVCDQRQQQQDAAAKCIGPASGTAATAQLEPAAAVLALAGGAQGRPETGAVLQQQEQQHWRPAVIGGIGVLALDCHVSIGKLAAMLAEAREFAAEWRELRGLHQARLHGKVLRVPLQQAVEEVEQAAAAAGQLGTSTSRFVDAQQRSDLALPPGAEWRQVRVLFKRYARETTYMQPFMSSSGGRLCINCAKAVPGVAAAQMPEAVLEGMTNLFCSGECEGRFALKSNGSAYRRALFKLERGVCISCRLDCHALVKRLQAVEKGSRGWEDQRRRIIAARAPRLLARGYKAYLDLLIRRAVEGNAWQADHILPVYKGGGLCDVDNLRTLCVACHADVTKEQVKDRAASRQLEKAKMASRGSGLDPGGDWLGLDAAAAGGEEAEGRPVLKRRARLQRLFCEDSDDAEVLPAAAPAAAHSSLPAGGNPMAALEPSSLQATAAAAADGRSSRAVMAWPRRTCLQPLMPESAIAESQQVAATADGGCAGQSAAADPQAAAGEQQPEAALPQELTGRQQQVPGGRPQLHRLARSSTGNEHPSAAELGGQGPQAAINVVYPGQGENLLLAAVSDAADLQGAGGGGGGGGDSKKRLRAVVAAAGGMCKPRKLERRARPAKKEYVDDSDC